MPKSYDLKSSGAKPLSRFCTSYSDVVRACANLVREYERTQSLIEANKEETRFQEMRGAEQAIRLRSVLADTRREIKKSSDAAGNILQTARRDADEIINTSNREVLAGEIAQGLIQKAQKDADQIVRQARDRAAKIKQDAMDAVNGGQYPLARDNAKAQYEHFCREINLLSIKKRSIESEIENLAQPQSCSCCAVEPAMAP